MLSEIAEEYLECVFELTERGEPAKTSEIAASLKVAPATVTEMIQKLAAEHYLNYEKYKGVMLTDKGMKVARRMKRKHRLVERFFYDIVGAKRRESHEEACRLEHVISDESERKICQMTNNPKFCPDGDPIPACEDGDCANCLSGVPMPLLELAEGENAEITHLKCEDSAKIRRLISMGFVPGTQVSIEEHLPMGGPVLVQLHESRIALAKDYANLIMVQKGGRSRRRSKDPLTVE
jgi:DtxR family Mn-dependent transcriptional regulator